MTMTGRTILGVFDESAMADQAIDALRTAGFSSNQVHEAGHHASGGFMAGIKNFFTGGDAATATDASDFSGMGIPNEEAQYYENEFQAGHRVVAVQANGREQEAMDILRTHGAYTYGTKRGTAASSTAASALNTTSTADATRTTRSRKTRASDTPDTTEERVLRLREEQLNVSKQRVQSGEVDLRKEVVTEQKTVNVPVMHEEAFLERRAVTSTSANDTTPIGEGESIRVPLSEERVNVSKETVVTGEVSIGKRAVAETKQVTDTVRREEVRVEQQGDAPSHGTKSDRFHPNSVDKDTL